MTMNKHFVTLMNIKYDLNEINLIHIDKDCFFKSLVNTNI